MKTSELAVKFDALSHKKRLEIFMLLSQKGIMTVNGVTKATGLPQPTVAQHLAKLYHAGLITKLRKGVEVWNGVYDLQFCDFIKGYMEVEQ